MGKGISNASIIKMIRETIIPIHEAERSNARNDAERQHAQREIDKQMGRIATLTSIGLDKKFTSSTSSAIKKSEPIHTPPPPTKTKTVQTSYQASPSSISLPVREVILSPSGMPSSRVPVRNTSKSNAENMANKMRAQGFDAKVVSDEGRYACVLSEVSLPTSPTIVSHDFVGPLQPGTVRQPPPTTPVKTTKATTGFSAGPMQPTIPSFKWDAPVGAPTPPPTVPHDFIGPVQPGTIREPVPKPSAQQVIDVIRRPGLTPSEKQQEIARIVKGKPVVATLYVPPTTSKLITPLVKLPAPLDSKPLTPLDRLFKAIPPKSTIDTQILEKAKSAPKVYTQQGAIEWAKQELDRVKVPPQQKKPYPIPTPLEARLMKTIPVIGEKIYETRTGTSKPSVPLTAIERNLMKTPAGKRIAKIIIDRKDEEKKVMPISAFKVMSPVERQLMSTSIPNAQAFASALFEKRTGISPYNFQDTDARRVTTVKEKIQLNDPKPTMNPVAMLNVLNTVKSKIETLRDINEAQGNEANVRTLNTMLEKINKPISKLNKDEMITKSISVDLQGAPIPLAELPVETTDIFTSAMTEKYAEIDSKRVNLANIPSDVKDQLGDLSQSDVYLVGDYYVPVPKNVGTLEDRKTLSIYLGACLDNQLTEEEASKIIGEAINSRLAEMPEPQAKTWMQKYGMFGVEGDKNWNDVKRDEPAAELVRNDKGQWVIELDTNAWAKEQYKKLGEGEGVFGHMGLPGELDQGATALASGIMGGLFNIQDFWHPLLTGDVDKARESMTNWQYDIYQAGAKGETLPFEYLAPPLAVGLSVARGKLTGHDVVSERALRATLRSGLVQNVIIPLAGGMAIGKVTSLAPKIGLKLFEKGALRVGSEWVSRIGPKAFLARGAGRVLASKITPYVVGAPFIGKVGADIGYTAAMEQKLGEIRSAPAGSKFSFGGEDYTREELLSKWETGTPTLFTGVPLMQVGGEPLSYYAPGRTMATGAKTLLQLGMLGAGMKSVASPKYPELPGMQLKQKIGSRPLFKKLSGEVSKVTGPVRTYQEKFADIRLTRGVDTAGWYKPSYLSRAGSSVRGGLYRTGIKRGLITPQKDTGFLSRYGYVNREGMTSWEQMVGRGTEGMTSRVQISGRGPRYDPNIMYYESLRTPTAYEIFLAEKYGGPAIRTFAKTQQKAFWQKYRKGDLGVEIGRFQGSPKYKTHTVQQFHEGVDAGFVKTTKITPPSELRAYEVPGWGRPGLKWHKGTTSLEMGDGKIIEKGLFSWPSKVHLEGGKVLQSTPTPHAYRRFDPVTGRWMKYWKGDPYYVSTRPPTTVKSWTQHASTSPPLLAREGAIGLYKPVKGEPLFFDEKTGAYVEVYKPPSQPSVTKPTVTKPVTGTSGASYTGQQYIVKAPVRAPTKVTALHKIAGYTRGQAQSELAYITKAIRTGKYTPIKVVSKLSFSEYKNALLAVISEPLVSRTTSQSNIHYPTTYPTGQQSPWQIPEPPTGIFKDPYTKRKHRRTYEEEIQEAEQATRPEQIHEHWEDVKPDVKSKTSFRKVTGRIPITDISLDVQQQGDLDYYQEQEQIQDLLQQQKEEQARRMAPVSIFAQRQAEDLSSIYTPPQEQFQITEQIQDTDQALRWRYRQAQRYDQVHAPVTYQITKPVIVPEEVVKGVPPPIPPPPYYHHDYYRDDAIRERPVRYGAPFLLFPHGRPIPSSPGGGGRGFSWRGKAYYEKTHDVPELGGPSQLMWGGKRVTLAKSRKPSFFKLKG